MDYMKRRRRFRSVAEVFARMDGRSGAFLVKELGKRGITLTPSCISNYRTGCRRPTDELLDQIVDILSPKQCAARVAASLDAVRAHEQGASDPYKHQVP
jgi:hypothetical protein